MAAAVRGMKATEAKRLKQLEQENSPTTQAHAG